MSILLLEIQHDPNNNGDKFFFFFLPFLELDKLVIKLMWKNHEKGTEKALKKNRNKGDIETFYQASIIKPL